MHVLHTNVQYCVMMTFRLLYVDGPDFRRRRRADGVLGKRAGRS